MTLNEKFGKKLSSIKKWKNETDQIIIIPSEIWNSCHLLAENTYLPALSFFFEGLYDSNWIWRENCLDMIGFHYIKSINEEMIIRIQELLLSESHESSRIKAANVLGLISKNPDFAIKEAIDNDQDYFVRSAAFLAYLNLAGIKYDDKLEVRDRLATREINPSNEELKRILHLYHLIS